MIEKNKNIQPVIWNEHVRLRPHMYMGELTTKSLINLFKSILSCYLLKTEADVFTLDFFKNNSGKITIDGINGITINIWDSFITNVIPHPHTINIQTLNALSENFKVLLFDENKTLIHQELYKSGISQEEYKNNREFNCSKIEVEFTLDSSIWKKQNYWNEPHLISEFLEFSFLNRNKSFHINTKDNELKLNSKEGLIELLKIETKNNFSPFFFQTEILEINNEFELEIALAFNYYFEDFTSKRSFVNNYETKLHGNHVKGIIKGIKKSLNEYLESDIKNREIKITNKIVRKHLNLAVNLILNEPEFHGTTRDKLGNKGIKNQIAEIVFNNLLPRLKKDKKLAISLLHSLDIDYQEF